MNMGFVQGKGEVLDASMLELEPNLWGRRCSECKVPTTTIF